MKTTFIPIVRTVKKDNTANVSLKILHNGERRTISLNFALPKSYLIKAKTKGGLLKWNFNEAAKREIETKVKPLKDELLKLGLKAKELNIDDLIMALLHPEPDVAYIDLFEYGKKVADEYTNLSKLKTAQGIITSLNKFQLFIGLPRYNINSITSSIMLQFQKSFADTKRAKTLYPAYLRIVINKAKEDFNDPEKGVIKITADPFFKVGNKAKVSTKYVSKGHRAISVEELRKIRDAKTVTIAYKTRHRTTGKMITTVKEEPLSRIKRAEIAHDIYLMSFYTMGMNLVDLWEFDTIKGDKICYNRRKVEDRREDEAYFEVRIEPELKPLLAKYRDKSKKRVLDLYKRYYALDGLVSAVNKGLKYFGEYTFYSARHTWATIAVNDCGVDKQLVHECLNHVDEKMKVTDVYVIKKFDKYWEVNRKVLDYIKG